MSTIIFENTQKLGENEFMTFVDGERLVKLWEKDNIKYIPEIQRGLKSAVNSEGEIFEVPVFSQINVNKIKKTIENNSFYVSQITLNLVKGTSRLKYNEENKELRITSGVLALLDGQHRIRALVDIKEQNPELDLKKLVFPVKITHYEEEKAQEQFYQFTLGNKISSSRSEYFNNKDYANKITRSLYNDSVLTNRIETVKNTISNSEKDHLVSYATLKNAIELNFNTNKLESIEEAEEISKYLKGFFKELFIAIPEFNDYEKRKVLKEENSLKCENFTFYGYVAIAEYLQDKENWKELLLKINDIDFSKTANLWVNQITKKNVVKRQSKNHEQEIKYTIINNSQSRKEMCNLLVKAFKKIVK